MKANCVVSVLALVAVPLLGASAKSTQPTAYQRARILTVEKHEVQSPQYVGGNPSDAPLSSEYYAYDVSVRVSCGTYVGHYESPYDYLPSGIAADQPVEVRLTKHDLYFDLPGDREMKMAITHRRIERGSPCGASTASR